MKAVREYETAVFDAVAPPVAIQVKLAQTLQRKISLKWLTDNRVEVTATQWVGVVDVPSLGRVRVLPKLAGDQLHVLGMLAFATGHSPGFLNELSREYEVDRNTDLAAIIARFLCREAEQILSAGLLRDYREHAEDLALVRGRLDVRRQGLTHFGRIDRLACQFESFDHDVLENRLIAQALSIARRFGEQPTKQLATRLLEDFREFAPGPLPQVSIARRQLTFDRRNQHYRPAILWSLALLEGVSVDDFFHGASLAQESFLIDMNLLYEGFLEQLVRRVLPKDWTVRAQVRNPAVFRGERRFQIRPDLLIAQGDYSYAIDAKYKRYDERMPTSADLYQMCIYAQCYPGRGAWARALLVYPSLTKQRVKTIEYRPQGSVVVEVVTVQLVLRQVVEDLCGIGDGTAVAQFSADLRKAMEQKDPQSVAID